MIPPNFCPNRNFDRSRKPSKKHRKSICHKGSSRTLKQRPGGCQNGAQMVPKPPKNEIWILTRKATSKKNVQISNPYIICYVCSISRTPEKQTFRSLFGDQNEPRSHPEGTCKTACKKVINFPKNNRKVTPEGPKMGA